MLTFRRKSQRNDCNGAYYLHFSTHAYQLAIIRMQAAKGTSIKDALAKWVRTTFALIKGW